MPPLTPIGSAPEEFKEALMLILKNSGVSDNIEDLVITEPPELKGEHMSTTTLYVTVAILDQKPKNLFVKKFTANPLHIQMIRQMKLMEKETSFFTEFLPFANQFCKENAGLDNFLDFFPKCVYGDADMLVLDNVVLNDNYMMVPRAKRQDLETAKVVLDNLAKFHAVTFAIINKLGTVEFIKKWELSTYEACAKGNNPFLDMIFNQAIGTCTRILKMQGDALKDTQSTIEKLQSYRPEFESLPHSLHQVEPEDTFVALNHGDCWNNNMLFKRDPETGNYTDHIFVDLQHTRLGPPTLDMGHYLFTSVQRDVRRNHLNELLEHYYEVYKATVELFNLKCPVTFEELQLSFKKNCSAGALFTISMLSAVEAIKGHNFNDTSEPGLEGAMKRFDLLISNWIKNNPDQASVIAQEITHIVDEYEGLKA